MGNFTTVTFIPKKLRFTKLTSIQRQLPVYFLIFIIGSINAQNPQLTLNEEEYFEKPGVNILAFSNWYDGLFSDSKISGIEIIHHGVRTVTNGDVRLHATPEQWDAIPTFVRRKVDRENNRIDTYEKYPDYNFEYMIRAELDGDAVILSVHLEESVPDTLIGRGWF